MTAKKKPGKKKATKTKTGAGHGESPPEEREPMTIIIAVTLPDLHATLPVADRNALQWAGVTTSLLRTSFHDAIYAVLRELFPRDTWRVEVREGLDHPAFSIESGAKVSSEKLSWAVHLAATCWVASVRHISIMRHRAAQG